MKIRTLKADHDIAQDISHDSADFLILPVNFKGGLVETNRDYQQRFRYLKDIYAITEEQISNGYGELLTVANQKYYFVISSKEGRSDRETFFKNLTGLLHSLGEQLFGKSVWIPAVQLGSDLQEYHMIMDAIITAVNNYSISYGAKATFLISVDNSQNGTELIQSMREGRIGSFNELVLPAGIQYYVAKINEIDEQTYQSWILSGSLNAKIFGDEAINISPPKQNDVIIFSVGPEGNSRQLSQILDLGIVTKDADQSQQLLIKWVIKSINESWIEGNHYNNGVHLLRPTDREDIIVNYGQILANHFANIFESATGKTTLATLISDTDKGTDYLDTKKDVMAFAHVIASTAFQPPLAIALFGKWGSGKSFFMNKLRENIEELQEDKRNIFFKGIAHIHFNAWAYMDANLWASFVTRIFEGLNEYIYKSDSQNKKDEIELELKQSLKIVSEQENELQAKQSAVLKNINHLTFKRRELDRILDKNIRKINNRALWKILRNTDAKFKARERLEKELRKNESFTYSENEIKKLIPEKYWNNPQVAYKEISSTLTFMRAFFRKKNILLNVLFISFVLLLIYYLPWILGLFSDNLKTINLTISQSALSVLSVCSTFLFSAQKTYKKLQPLIASFWEIKEDYVRQKDEAISEFEQKEKSLKLEIEKNKEELILVDDQLHKAIQLKNDIDFKLKNTLATDALYRFIARRSSSDDYSKHLGIISTIRKDFEILNTLFVEHNQELLDTDDVNKFRGYFKVPLERIVLYIDDLDRCPEETVVNVLEAVHLLMAFKLFVVVVGVDPRWIKNALHSKFQTQFPKTLEESVSNGIDVGNYLEKIFQVPFHLKKATQKNVREMIRQRANIEPNIPKPASASSSKKPIEETNGQDAVISTENMQETEPDTSATEGRMDKKSVGNQPTDKKEKIGADYLKLSEDEVLILEDLSEIVGANPRALKRFLNIYMIIKAHEDFLGAESTPKQTIAVLLIIAISVGNYRKIYGDLEDYIKDKAFPDKSLNKFLNSTGSSTFNIEKKQLLMQLGDLSHVKSILTATAFELSKDYDFIRRFTFNNN